MVDLRGLNEDLNEELSILLKSFVFKLILDYDVHVAHP